MDHKENVMICNYGILAFSAFSVTLFSIKNLSKNYQTTKLDICICCLFAWMLIDSFWINDRVLSDEKLILIITSFIVYFTSKLTTLWTEKVLAIIIMLGGFLQSLIAWCQCFEVLDSNHLEFMMTGSFYNPAHLGAYTGLSIICTIYLLYAYYQRMKFYRCIVLSFLFLSMFGVLILSFSRASWVALSIILLLVLWKYHIFKYKTYCGMAFLIFISLLPLLYQLKKASADGRLFIWNVSKELVSSAPLLGRGADSFTAEYMLAQADFFERYPNSEYRMNATDNVHAFNEYLRITCEYGIIGLLFLGVILFLAIKSKGNTLIKWMVGYICIFACFSYVVEVSALLIVCSIFMGKLSNNSHIQYTYQHNSPWPIAICFSGIILFSLFRCQQEKCLSNYLSAYTETKGEDVEQKLLAKYRSNRYNRTFVLRCAHQLYNSKNYIVALPYLQQAFLLSPVSEICMDLGNCFYYLEDSEKAEYYLTKAHYMVPSHILPRYYLFRIYAKQGDIQKAYSYGTAILSEEFKKEGSVAMEVKYRIKKYLDENFKNAIK